MSLDNMIDGVDKVIKWSDLSDVQHGHLENIAPISAVASMVVGLFLMLIATSPSLLIFIGFVLI